MVGVTDVLKTAGMIDTGWYTDEGRQRGQDVHTACECIDTGGLDWPDFEARFPALVGYAHAYEQFKADTGFIPWLVEKALYHPRLHYAGRPDRFGINELGALWLPDIKTGKPEPWAGIQTAAYEDLVRHELIGQTMGRPILRLAVELREDGKWRGHFFKDPQDWTVFQSAYNVANWIAQKQNGGKYADH